MIKHKNFIEFKKLFGNNIVPFEAVVEITSNCNLKCIHCNRTIKNEYMKVETFKYLLDELKKFGTMKIFFTGGEPSLHPSFFKILKLTAENKFTFAVQTNLTNLKPAEIEFFKNCVFWTSLQISLYGYNENSYFKTCKTKNVFDKVKINLDALKNIKKLLILKTLVTKENIGYLKEIENFGKKYTKNHFFDFTVFPDDEGSYKHKNLRADINDYKNYINSILRTTEINKDSNENSNKISNKDSNEVSNSNKIMSSKICSQNKNNVKTNKNQNNEKINLIEYNKEKNSIFNKNICSAGSTNICITSSANVLPCVALRINCGNILKKSLKEIWYNSKELKKLRNYKILDLKECVNCEILNECKYKCPGLFYSENNNLLKPSQYRCELTKIQTIK